MQMKMFALCVEDFVLLNQVQLSAMKVEDIGEFGLIDLISKKPKKKEILVLLF